MEAALVLTEEKASDRGMVGAGPFTFGGAFPGEWIPGRPVAIRFLGFDDADATEAALVAAFEEGHDLLEWTEVEDGEGLPVRENHALSELEYAEEASAAVVEEASSIRTHKDADAVAAELGITFPDGAKLDEKRDAIASVREGVVDGHVAGDPQELTPAPGAEETVPVEPVAEEEETQA